MGSWCVAIELGNIINHHCCIHANKPINDELSNASAANHATQMWDGVEFGGKEQGRPTLVTDGQCIHSNDDVRVRRVKYEGGHGMSNDQDSS